MQQFMNFDDFDFDSSHDDDNYSDSSDFKTANWNNASDAKNLKIKPKKDKRLDLSDRKKSQQYRKMRQSRHNF